MTKVIADMSMSLDGFIAGPDDDVDRLHQWLYGLAGWRAPHGIEGGEENRDSEVVAEGFEGVGAAVMGRRMFELGSPHWGDDPPFHVPVFVLTHEARPVLTRASTSFIFVNDGIEDAVRRATEAAGDRDVSISGGASVVRQCIRAGRLDELQVHIVPVLLGDGIRLFEGSAGGQVELEPVRVLASPAVTHVKYAFR